MLQKTLRWTLALGLAALSTLSLAGEKETLTVMTWNLYVGASTEEILAAPTLEAMAERADEAWRTLEATRFDERVVVIAQQIAAQKPQLIGLQEVALLRVQSPGDRIKGGLKPATTVVYDFEIMLLKELRSLGLDYRVINSVQNADVEVPRANATLDDVRLTDRDLILARGDVVAEAALSGSYQTALSLPFPDGKSALTVSRGYTGAKFKLQEQSLLFVNSHLEIGRFQDLQRAQATELVNRLSMSSLPLILLGDFNASPAAAESSYHILTQAGFRDVWKDRRGEQDLGLTCCQLADLANPESTLEERIDLIFTRNVEGLFGKEVETRLIGNRPADKTPGGLWPSDHAGVVAQFELRSL